jgi:two-component system, LytTR family, response regulator
MNPINSNPSLSFNTHSGKLIINLNEIAYCEAQGAYSIICNLDGRKNLVSKNLKALECYLSKSNFLRVHSSHLVNKDNVTSYNKSSSQITLINGGVIPVSRRKSGCLRMLFKLNRPA